MGCSTTREVLESKMLLLKLRRIESKKAREDNCKELSKVKYCKRANQRLFDLS